MTSILLANASAKVQISPLLGGAILTYDAKINDLFVPILRDGSAAKSVRETSCFPLVPYSNRIRDGQFEWRDSIIKLPLNHLPEKHSIHGHGWQAPWQVLNQTETSLNLEYHHQADAWPFSYSAQQLFTLENNSLSLELCVTNHSNKPMPAGLGFHPYFSVTDKAFLSSSVDAMWAVDTEKMPTELVEPARAINDREGLLIKGSNLDNVFTGYAGNSTLYWPEWQAKANICSSNNCQFVVLFSPVDKHHV